MITKDYGLKKIFQAIIFPNTLEKSYLLGIFLLLVSFGIITRVIGKVIDQNADDLNKTLEIYKREIEFLKK